MYAKNGAPISAVIAPTGNSDGAVMVRAARSQITMKVPPNRNDMGITIL